jgi:hypothetical protein
MFHYSASFNTKFWQGPGGIIAATYYLLQEDGFKILQEDGSAILLESAP